MAHGIYFDFPNVTDEADGNWSVGESTPINGVLITEGGNSVAYVDKLCKGTMTFKLVKKENGVEEVVEQIVKHGKMDTAPGPGSPAFYRVRLEPAATSSEETPTGIDTHFWKIGPEFEDGSYIEVIFGGTGQFGLSCQYESDTDSGTSFAGAWGQGHVSRKLFFKYQAY